MHHFVDHEGRLRAEDVDLAALADEVGTPFYCYSTATLERHYRVFRSAFAERAVVSRRSLVKIDPALSFEEAALFGCAVLTGVGAVVNTAQIKAGQSAVVVGLGGVGLASVLGALSTPSASRARTSKR